MTIRHIYEAGDTVIVEGDYAGTQTGPLVAPSGTIPATDRVLLVPVRRCVHGLGRQDHSARRVFGTIWRSSQLGVARQPERESQLARWTDAKAGLGRV